MSLYGDTKSIDNEGVPPEAIRAYISAMLGELCQLAENTEQNDLFVLLTLAQQTALHSSDIQSLDI